MAPQIHHGLNELAKRREDWGDAAGVRALPGDA
jgi:hypothetical protein